MPREKSREKEKIMKNNDYPMNLILDLSTDRRPIDTTNLPHDYDIFVEYALRRLEGKWARDVQMVRMRYRDGMTFQAIGATYGLTRERVRQCIHRVLRRIRGSRLFMDLICRGAEIVVEEFGKDQYSKGYQDGFTNGFVEGASSEGSKRSKTFHGTVDNIPLEDLGLSVRAYNVLYWAQKRTAGEIAACSFDDLRKMRNLGKKTLLEIVDKMRSLGYDTSAMLSPTK